MDNEEMLPETNGNVIDRSNLVVLENVEDDEDDMIDDEPPRSAYQLTEEEKEELKKLEEIRNELVRTNYSWLPLDSIQRLILDHQMFGIPRPDVAFHTDCWPPKPIGSSIVVETYQIIPAHFEQFFPPVDHARIYERDSMIKTAQEIKEFIAREDVRRPNSNVQLVVIVNKDEECARLADLLLTYKVPSIYFSESSSHDICPSGIERVLEEFRSGKIKVFVCTWALERLGALIPFAEHTIVHKLDMHSVFMKSFASRQSERSRRRKQPSFIKVKLGVFDNKKTVRDFIELLYSREEYPSDYEVSVICHFFPSRDLVNLNTLSTLKALKEAERKDTNERLLELLGPHFDRWWDDLEMVAKIEKHVKPETEFPEHRQPLRRAPVCYAECAAHLAGLRYNLDDESCILPRNHHD